MREKIGVVALSMGLLFACNAPEDDSRGTDDNFDVEFPPGAAGPTTPGAPSPTQGAGSSTDEGAKGSGKPVVETGTETSTTGQGTGGEASAVGEAALAALGAIALEPPLAGSVENSLLSKPIDARIIGDAHGLEVVHAYATRSDVRANHVETVVTLRNRGTQTLCDAQATNVRLLDRSGIVLAEEKRTFMDSPTGSSTYCLAPGETGYVLGLSRASFDSTARTEFGIESGDETSSFLSHALVATSAGISGPNQFHGMTVTFENVSPDPLQVPKRVSGKWLLFGGDGTPLSWGFLNSCGSAAAAPLTVSPGQTVELCDPWVYFAGRGAHVVSWVDLVY